MNEFIRDMIANVNGMYHVMTVDPDLLKRSGRVSAGHPALKPEPASAGPEGN
jgi:hypothetical protein